MTEQGGLHCGVRVHSLPLYNEEGTTAIGIYVTEEEIGVGFDELLEIDTAKKPWKYPTPNVSNVDPLSCLNRSELRFLHIHMEQNTQLWSDIDAHLSS